MQRRWSDREQIERAVTCGMRVRVGAYMGLQAAHLPSSQWTHSFVVAYLTVGGHFKRKLLLLQLLLQVRDSGVRLLLLRLWCEQRITGANRESQENHDTPINCIT